MAKITDKFELKIGDKAYHLQTGRVYPVIEGPEHPINITLRCRAESICSNGRTELTDRLPIFIPVSLAIQLGFLEPKTMKTVWKPGRTMDDGYMYVGIAYDEAQKKYYRFSIEPHSSSDVCTHTQATYKIGNDLPTKNELLIMAGSLPKSMLPVANLWSASPFSWDYAWYFYGSSGSISTAPSYERFHVSRIKRFDYSK